MRVLTLNSGSSSLKFGLFDVPQAEARSVHGILPTVIAGEVKGIGQEAELRLRTSGTSLQKRQRGIKDHQQAVQWVFEQLAGETIEAIGHRVVHGGESFVDSVRIDAGVITEIERLSELAPLHNPAGVGAIQGAQAALGDIPMVAVFDTAFHQTLPLHAATYAIPQELASRHRIRRYGFHGIAHASLAAGYAAHTGRPLDRVRLITLHLGNGCSAAAIRHGRSVETSMGFTPLEGLVMGTRSGDLDPAVVSYLARWEGTSADTVERWLNQRSGLLGLSRRSHDMRELLRLAGRDDAAAFAIELFCYRVRKYLGAYLAVLGGADAVVLGGGIGERSPEIRASVCEGMSWCGLLPDRERNLEAQGLPPCGGARSARTARPCPRT